MLRIVADARPDLTRWLGRGFWAVTDYGLFAFSSLVLSLMMARWLPPAAYGAFTVAFTIFLLIGTFHVGLLVEPMLVFGADRRRDRLPDYLDGVLCGHLGFSIFAILVCVLVGLGLWLAGWRALYPTLFSLGAAAPWILSLWLMRTACYVRLKTHVAATGGLLYLLLMVGGIYALHARDWLSPASAIGVMGISSLAAALWLAARLNQGLPHLRGSKVLHDIMSSHWRFGRWMIGNNLLYWFMTQVWYIVLPVWGGLAASGAFRALVVLTLPPTLALYALSRVLLGSLVRERGGPRFGDLLRAGLLLFLVGSTLSWVLLGAFGGFLLTSVYDGQYAEYRTLLWVLGAMLPLEGAIEVLRAALQALERPDLVFWARVFSSLVVCTVGLPLALTFGMSGAGIGFLLAHLVSAGTMWVSFRSVAGLSGLQTAAVKVLVQSSPS